MILDGSPYSEPYEPVLQLGGHKYVSLPDGSCRSHSTLLYLYSFGNRGEGRLAMRFFRWWAVGLILALALVACGGAQTYEGPLPDAAAPLTKAATAVKKGKSIKNKIELSGAPRYIDHPPNHLALVFADRV